eukprot:12327559-Karenia_brevis.AAC.1
MLSGVFNNVVMRVSLDRLPGNDTHVAAFVERLRQQPALFFMADPELEVPARAVLEGNAGEDEQEDGTQAPS